MIFEQTRFGNLLDVADVVAATFNDIYRIERRNAKEEKKRTKNQSFKSQLFAQRVEGKSSLFFCCQKSESSKFVKKTKSFHF